MPITDREPRIALKNILIATDFSAVSRRAYEYAISFAQRYSADLYVAHLVNPAPYATGRSRHTATKNLEDARKELGVQLQDLALEMTRKGVPTGALLGEGYVDETIDDMVQKRKIDLVVTGTRGGDRLSRLVLGSTAEEIFRTVACPVLTVGPQVLRHPNTEIEFKHILYATNLGPQSAHALQYALSLAEEYHAILSFMHVVSTDNRNLTEIDEEAEYCAREMRRLVSRGVEHWCQPAFVVERGSPAKLIVDYANESGVDLIILGANQGTHLTSHLIGGTAHPVVSLADCPVLTIRRD